MNETLKQKEEVTDVQTAFKVLMNAKIKMRLHLYECPVKAQSRKVKPMNKQQRLREIDGMRQACLDDIAEAQVCLRELNTIRQNVMMTEED